LVFSLIQNAFAESEIPDWVKNNAGWWAEGKITDSDFVFGMEYLINNKILKIPLTTQEAQNKSDEIPSWIKSNADWWSQGFISDSDFISGIQYLLNQDIIKLKFDKLTEITTSKSIFKIFFDEKDLTSETIASRFHFELKPELRELYEMLKPHNQNTIVVYPSFTLSAYTEPGFYNYYRGECDENCLETIIRYDFEGNYNTGNSAYQLLKLLGYNFITDIDIDKNPQNLKNYDKVILLHNEYVTKTEFDAITNHPNVIYLYPNALYAEVEYDETQNTIKLIRGHNYPELDIKNGFDWEFDNTHPYEYDSDCFDWQFYKIGNGIMLNCYPEKIIFTDAFLLKAITDSHDPFWWTATTKYKSLVTDEEFNKLNPILELLP